MTSRLTGKYTSFLDYEISTVKKRDLILWLISSTLETISHYLISMISAMCCKMLSPALKYICRCWLCDSTNIYCIQHNNAYHLLTIFFLNTKFLEYFFFLLELIYRKWFNFLVKESFRKKKPDQFWHSCEPKYVDARGLRNSRIWGKT